ncbi:hypothetical protein NW759_016530 [Fusarium solani]|nr:hypothetical protein NW759_016530 [Fusarium solani]
MEFHLANTSDLSVGGGHGYTMVNIEQGFTGEPGPRIAAQEAYFGILTRPLHADPTDIIKASARLGKPIITVHFSYRLNVFGYGVFGGKTNFGFHDQKRAIEWVRKHIAGFGGDPGNITILGESAGAIAAHGHIHGPTPTKGVRRAILQSGSLYVTGPTPQAVGEAIMKRLASISESSNLQTLPVDKVLTGLQKLGIRNWWLHEEDDVFVRGTDGHDWPISKDAELETLLIGDCQWESRGFEAHVAAVGLEKLEEVFNEYSPAGQEVLKLYDINFSSMEVARPRISAFINDLKFALAAQEIPKEERLTGKRTCYRYLVDQPNPWKKTAGAHHAVDLIFLFGGPFDYSHDSQAVTLGNVMREKWITFLHGETPWDPSNVFAFGPEGACGTIDEEEVGRRRRVRCVDGLQEIGWARCQPLATRLLGARGVVTEAYL